MRRIIFTFICCMLFMAATAQRITRKYNNVSLSEALRQLNEQSEEYTISFLYNELEDFRITTSVHHKTQIPANRKSSWNAHRNPPPDTRAPLLTPTASP